MERNSKEFKELVYECMIGAIRESCRDEELKCVEDEYREGSACDLLYKKVYEACERICEKAGTSYGEDKDLECIMGSLLEIQQILCCKMYDYGWEFANKERSDQNK